MLVLDEKIKSQMIQHAISVLPYEACGLFLAKQGSNVIESFYPMRNIAESDIIYQIDPLEMMKLEDIADKDGNQIIGVMHSHTHTPAYPSPTDVKDAGNFDPLGTWHYLIVSLEGSDPSIRSFRILNGNITEEEIQLT